MNKLQAGFARADITPMRGIPFSGYYYPRYMDGVLDALEINALALSDGENTALILTFDTEGLFKDTSDDLRKAISAETGVSAGYIFIHATHTHTSPLISVSEENELLREFYSDVRHKAVDCAKAAIEDLSSAKMGYGTGIAPGIAFVRRYRMKDGSVMTNPGVGNPDIAEPLGKVDERVEVVRFKRENAEDIILAEFGLHPDNIGDCKASADWVGFARRHAEKLLDNTKCIVLDGAEGDINSLMVHPTGGYLNDMVFFDDGPRCYSNAEHLGNTVLCAILQVYTKEKYVDVQSIKCASRFISVPSNKPSPEELPEAHRINGLYKQGRDRELPYEGMELTTVVAEAVRMCDLEHGPDSFEMELTAMSLGEIAFIGIPGEPFAEIGMELKKAEGYEMIIPSCITNGKHGYFPTREAYRQGGYETRCSVFREGCAEIIIEEGKKLLKILK